MLPNTIADPINQYALFLGRSVSGIGIQLISSVLSSTQNQTHKHEYLKHCIQYLTQGVLRAGDIILEEATLPETRIGLKGVSTRSWGASHTYVDWNAVYSFAREQRWETYK